MKITGISVWRVDLALLEGIYKWGGGGAVAALDSTVVRVETDAGITGWGEVCPLGATYLPAYAEGARAGIAELAPHLIGRDPRALGEIEHMMDRAMKGHPYAKAPLDIACWDILGHATGLSVATLLGGHYGDELEVMRAINVDTPEAMAAKTRAEREKGYRIFQVKVGDAPELDIARVRAVAAELREGDRLVADANTKWTKHQAMRFARGAADLDIYLEQPCPTYEECLSVRRATTLPFMLDECIQTVDDLIRAQADGAVDAIGLKLSRVGGLTKMRKIRDLCAALGIPHSCTDSWGGDIVTAAMVQLGASTPESQRFWTFDFNYQVSPSFAEGAPQSDGHGRITVPKGPGLGIKPRMDVLGDPLFTIT